MFMLCPDDPVLPLMCFSTERAVNSMRDSNDDAGVTEGDIFLPVVRLTHDIVGQES